ncbi:hypothetical protein HJG60_012107 [Phyllostomus discolor]|uniref:Uncharacterized protein n=1 Tax=Phyllostomus discolor TaxID=89673 RepID=A0A834DT64_9CHIR|nr:hypothetical protein HJG60_012107 [Phyllostomus discolor]
MRVISNAMGTNPLVCAATLDETAGKAGVDLNIAVVTGDDIMGEKEALQRSAVTDTESGKKFPDTMRSMDVYLGVRPISRALDLGADVVLTGRCVDSAVVLGPLIHAVPAILRPQDSPVLRASFSAAFADFTKTKWHPCEGTEGGAVCVQGAKGSPPLSFYKVSACYHDGFKATALCPMGGPKATEKGRRAAESILKRTSLMFEKAGLEDYSEVHVQILGSEEAYGAQAKANLNGGPGEAVLWLSVHHKEKKAVEIFSREIVPAGTGMAPGLTGVVGGRPKVSPVLKPFFFLYPKQKVKVGIHLINGGHIETFHEDLTFTLDTLASPNLPKVDDDLKDLPGGSLTYRLEDLAYTRSGDKGNSANIGIIAGHPLYYPYLKKFLTAQAIEDFFQHILHKEQPEENSVIRYELPGIYALNFILKNSLGGGGTASLRSDPQGKALGQMVPDFQIKDVSDLKALVGG